MEIESYHLAIAELAIYATTTVPGVFVLYKHGRRGLPAWFFLISFLLLQLVAQGLIVGAGPDSTSETGLIISQVGLSPLLMATEGILREAVSETLLTDTILYGRPSAIIFHLMVLTSAPLIGVGASELYGGNAASNGSTLAKTGVTILLVCFVWLVVLEGIALFHYRRFESFRPLLWAGAFALPWLLLRIIYSFVAFFSPSDQTFSPVQGNFTVKVIMQALPLLLISIGYTIGGILTSSVPRTNEKDQSGA